MAKNDWRGTNPPVMSSGTEVTGPQGGTASSGYSWKGTGDTNMPAASPTAPVSGHINIPLNGGSDSESGSGE